MSMQSLQAAARERLPTVAAAASAQTPPTTPSTGSADAAVSNTKSEMSASGAAKSAGIDDPVALQAKLKAQAPEMAAYSDKMRARTPSQADEAVSARKTDTATKTDWASTQRTNTQKLSDKRQTWLDAGQPRTVQQNIDAGMSAFKGQKAPIQSAPSASSADTAVGARKADITTPADGAKAAPQGPDTANKADNAVKTQHNTVTRNSPSGGGGGKPLVGNEQPQSFTIHGQLTIQGSDEMGTLVNATATLD